MGDKFEAFKILAEETDIYSDIEVEEKEVKGYNDYKGQDLPQKTLKI